MRRLVLLVVFFFPSFSFGQWLPEEQQSHLKNWWPKGVPFPKDGKFYDHEPAYQDDGLHSPSYNIAARPDPFGNANREFPWGTPAGLHKAVGWAGYKLASIPGPIKWWREHRSPFSNESAAYVWEYPENTTFAEMLLVKDKKGNDWTFEVRIRTKKGELWEPAIYRPFSEDDVPFEGKWVEAKVLGHGVESTVKALDVGRLDPATWLDRPFKRSKLVLTSSVDGSIVPKGYLGNITNCVSCHSQTLKHARVIDSVREWYGSVRGSDQIFSFHIFDPSCISRNGFSLPVVFHRGLKLERKE